MISLLLPTRKRPDNVVRLWESVAETADRFDDLEFVIVHDDDDDSYKDVKYLGGTRWVRVPRQVMAQYWNIAYLYSEGELVMQAADDLIFRTKGWDTTVKEAFAVVPDRILFAFGDDGTAWNGNYGTHGFVHRRWVDAIGYFVPPYFVSDFTDKWLNEVAEAIGRHTWIPILTEHMHPDVGKGPEDEVHQERRERHRRERPDLLYDQLAGDRARDVRTLQRIIDAAMETQ